MCMTLPIVMFIFSGPTYVRLMMSLPMEQVLDFLNEIEYCKSKKNLHSLQS